MGFNYLSLDEAREEAKQRWENAELKEKIEKELGDNFIKHFAIRPRAGLFRQLCQADNGFTFFFQCARYIDIDPLVLEYHDDIFVHFNEEKKGLGRLKVVLKDGSKSTVDIMNFHENEKLKLKDVKIKTGEKLIDFHHAMAEKAGYKVDMIDNSNWFHNLGKAKDYYYYFLLHFVSHGILFEVFQETEEDDSEGEFNDQIVFPAIQKIKEKFGFEPMIFRLYPKNQSEEEDFYWWCYPPHVNDYIVDYAKRFNLYFKKVNLGK